MRPVVMEGAPFSTRWGWRRCPLLRASTLLRSHLCFGEIVPEGNYMLTCYRHVIEQLCVHL